jgi:hypothetical protein
MENEELERVTGKMVWALLPTVVSMWVVMRVLEWMLKEWDELGLRAARRARLLDEEQEDA